MERKFKSTNKKENNTVFSVAVAFLHEKLAKSSTPLKKLFLPHVVTFGEGRYIMQKNWYQIALLKIKIHKRNLKKPGQT